MTVEEIFAALEGKFDVKREPLDKWGITAVVAAPYLHNAVQFLKEESGIKFDMLVDIAGIDYLTYPNHEGPRFAVSYAFKSMKNPGARIRLKVLVSEESLKVPTISDLYANANWYEREVFDQFGIVFQGHPDLRRRITLPRSASGFRQTTTCFRNSKSVSKNLATRSSSALRKWKRTTMNFWKGVSRNDRIRSEWRKAEFDALERWA